MALIRCPECGGQVSDTCDVCIHCGYKLKSDENVEEKKENSKDPMTLGYRGVPGYIKVTTIISFVVSFVSLITAFLCFKWSSEFSDVGYGTIFYIDAVFLCIVSALLFLLAVIYVFKISINKKASIKCIVYYPETKTIKINLLSGNEKEFNIKDFIALKGNFWTDFTAKIVFLKNNSSKTYKLGFVENLSNLKKTLNELKNENK